MLGSFELGRVHCVDCLEGMKKLPDGSVDLVLADPPYGENQASWDSEKPSTEIWPQMYQVMKPNSALYYWGFWGHADWVLSNAKRVGLVPLSRIVWWFRTGMPQKISYREDAETAWYFGKGEPYFNPSQDLEPYEKVSNYARYGRAGKHPGTVWTSTRILHNHPENVGHETQKPVDIIQKMARISCPPDGLILDPFMGSGTTGVAAVQLGRRFLGFEIDPEYCQLANDRIAAARKGMKLNEFRAGQLSLFEGEA